jgi:hypothetical protein
MAREGLPGGFEHLLLSLSGSEFAVKSKFRLLAFFRSLLIR